MELEKQFHWIDYLVFGVSLAISIVVGIIIAVKNKWLKQSTESYLMADRRMNWIPVALSFYATMVSAVYIVGSTTDYYYYGMTAIWGIIGKFIGGSFAVLVVIPKFFRMGIRITSAYEYFEHRFSMAVRMAVGVVYILTTLLYLAVVMYVPGLMLEAVSALNIYWSIGVAAVVCIVYTTIGGIKGVIWVDSIQVFIIMISLIVLVAKGVEEAGGMQRVWHYYTEIGHRDNWDDINTDPWNRHTVWNMIFLEPFFIAGAYSVNQAVLQRYMTVNDMHFAQRSALLGMVVGVLISIPIKILAMVAFANLGGNEPMWNIPGQKRDQIVPYFLMHVLGHNRGVPGLMLSALFAAALSTLSSGLNSVATIITKDFIEPIYMKAKHKKMSSNKVSMSSKITAVLIGGVVLALCLAVPNFNDTVISLGISVVSFLYGPLLGVMILGFFCFWVEKWGALFGLICSIGWAVMMYFGKLFNSNRLGRDPLPWFNNNFTEIRAFQDPTVTPVLFDVSYKWYVLLDIVVCVVVATVISLPVHCFKNKGKLEMRKMMPPKHLRYTLKDLKMAVSCSKTVKQDEEEEKLKVQADSAGEDFPETLNDPSMTHNGNLVFDHVDPESTKL